MLAGSAMLWIALKVSTPTGAAMATRAARVAALRAVQVRTERGAHSVAAVLPLRTYTTTGPAIVVIRIEITAPGTATFSQWWRADAGAVLTYPSVHALLPALAAVLWVARGVHAIGRIVAKRQAVIAGTFTCDLTEYRRGGANAGCSERWTLACARHWIQERRWRSTQRWPAFTLACFGIQDPRGANMTSASTVPGDCRRGSRQRDSERSLQ
jgi:hypothetical protein